jgi:anti-sigma B factor antagonist
MEASKKSVAQLQVVDGIPVVEVSGEVDIANVAQLNDVLRSAGEHDAGAVVVSLEQATYFDSAAIHALISFRVRLSTCRQSLLIVQPATSAGLRILEISGLVKEDTVVATREAAIRMANDLSAQRGKG